MLVTAVVRLGLLLVLVAAPGLAHGETCPERERCTGCGCAGGPGYRGPNGQCVGFKALVKVCGSPPTLRCIFENAPGTGANRECALAPPAKRRGAAPEEGASP
ncbi:MAG: hypothetical protein JWM36_4806 [Hyphomicrobiales bacterium]|nr:hypothetical protein [Hyphomicrobiales bacterium]